MRAAQARHHVTRRVVAHGLGPCADRCVPPRSACRSAVFGLRWLWLGDASMTAMTVPKRHHGYARAAGARFGVLAAAASLIGPSAAHAQVPGPRPAAAPGELLVQFEPGTSGAAGADLRDAAGTRVEEGLREPGLQRLSVEAGTSVEGAIRSLEASPDVRFAQPNITYRAAAVGPDPKLPLWNLDRIHAPQSWAVTTGSPSVTVAVIDSGIAAQHADLGHNVDTSRGRDFVDVPGDPVGDAADLNGHGTHVAGTIAAEGNNGIGIAGVAPNSRLVSVRVLDGYGEGTSAELAQGLDYAGDIGAQVANVSISGAGIDPAVSQAVATHPNTLYVVAAGNDAGDNDLAPQTPCNVDAPNLICVAATSRSDGLAGFSNTGASSVDLGAPGTEILSARPPRNDLATWRFEGSLTSEGPGPSKSWDRLGWDLSPDGHSVTDSPVGPYPINANTSLITHDRLDFTRLDGCAVDYRLKLDTFRAPIGSGLHDDFFRVMTTPDRVISTVRDEFPGETRNPVTRQLEFAPLRTYLDSGGQPVYLRLNLIGNGDGPNIDDGVYVDDVVVSCNGGSTDEHDDYVALEGTSMATPHVSGTAALIWAARSHASVADVRCDLLGSGAPLPALSGRTVTGRRVDAAAAVGGTRSAQPPAQTGGADGVTTTGATLHGAADPCGTASAYQFEFGTTEAYGSAPAAGPIGAGDSALAVSSALSGLAPGTTYHYRLVTIRGGARLAGADRTFTTGPPPVTPSTPSTLTLKDVVVRCARTGHGRRRTVRCRLRRASAVRRLSARLTKSGRLYARVTGRPPSTGRVTLKLVRRLSRGRYRVTMTLRDAKGAKRTKRLTGKV